MTSKVSQKGKRDTFSAPRLLTPSEIGSLRRDAIATSQEAKRLIAERSKRQKNSINALMNIPVQMAAE